MVEKRYTLTGEKMDKPTHYAWINAKCACVRSLVMQTLLRSILPSRPPPSSTPSSLQSPPPTTSHPAVNTHADFLQGGMELKLSVAIDFTASNGDISQPTSLHHIGVERRCRCHVCGAIVVQSSDVCFEIFVETVVGWNVVEIISHV